jgi:hypothetical protein
MTIRHGDLRLERDGDVAEIVWAAPTLNLFTPEVADAYDAVLDDLPSDVRALMVRAEGKVFCAGVQAQQFTTMDAAAGTAFSRRLLGLIHRIERLPLPTIAVVHALNLTIGLELTLACDFIWAASEASMGLVGPGGHHTRRGGTSVWLRAQAWHTPPKMVLPANHDRLCCMTGVSSTGFYRGRVAGEGPPIPAPGRTMRRPESPSNHQAHRERGVAAADAATPELAGPILSSEDAAIGVEALLTHGPGAKPAFRGR